MNTLHINTDQTTTETVKMLLELTQYHGAIYVDIYKDFAAKQLEEAQNWLNAPHSEKKKNGQSEYFRLEKKYYKFRGMNREIYLEKAEKEAQENYKNAITKLATRLQNKGLNLETIKLESFNLEYNNIDMLLTDGTKTIRAWNIVAEGWIQRPHYRFLVK